MMPLLTLMPRAKRRSQRRRRVAAIAAAAGVCAGALTILCAIGCLIASSDQPRCTALIVTSSGLWSLVSLRYLGRRL